MTFLSRIHPSMIISCALIWCLLRSDLSVAKLVFGAVLGILIALVFPLPSLHKAGQFRPVGVIRLVASLIYDLIRSSVAVLIVSVRAGYVPQNAIVGVRLRSRSDLYLTLTANLVSLVPGTVVVEARRSNCTIYVHALDSGDADNLDHVREIVLTAEARVLRAFGNAAERAALKTGEPMPGVEGEPR